MKIYTKTGDDGTTGLFGGDRVRKDDPRVDAYGTVDETNAVLGLARAEGLPEAVDGLLAEIQGELFVVGAELACAPGKADKLQMELVGDAAIERLEAAIDAMEVGLPALKNFVLPGGTRAAATLHLARTVCRRAERALVEASQPDDARPEPAVYLNRLSDLLFVLARRCNHEAGVADVPWAPRG